MIDWSPVRASLRNAPSLPVGWTWARLAEVARLESGHTPSRRRPDYWDGDVRWLSLKDIRDLQGRYIVETADRPTHLGIANSSARVLPKGTVALCRTASVGKTVILGRDMATSQDFVNWICGSNLLPEYLYAALLASASEFDRIKQGSTHKTIYMPTVEGFHVALPPVPEQRRIAAILDQAESLRANRRRALGMLDVLIDSLFVDAVGDPVANEKGWTSCRVSDFVAGFESGKNIVASDDDDSASDFRVLKVSAVTSLTYRPDEAKALPENYQPPASHLVRAGDLLFSRANTTELVGATVFVFHTPPMLALPDKIWRFVWPEQPRSEPLFVWFLFRHPALRRELGKRATGTSGSMKNISQEKVLSLRVGLPPLPLQRAFAAQVVAVERLKSSQRASLAKLDALFASLQHRAFRGEL